MAWNRRESEKEEVRRKKYGRRGVPLVLLVSVVLFLFGIALWWAADRSCDVQKVNGENTVKNRSMEIGSADRRKPRAEPKVLSTAPRKVVSAGNETNAADVGQEATQSDGTNSANVATDTRTFKNPMDQLLSMVAPRNAGDAIPPVPIVDGMEFSEEEERKILEQLTADDRDSDAVLDRKEFVQALRNEYFELKKRGWTFVEYIRALEAKANLDNEVLEESQRIHETIFNDSSISDEVYAKTLETINKMLADRGIKPIKPPPIENDGEN